jgi:hypothetical protein
MTPKSHHLYALMIRRGAIGAALTFAASATLAETYPMTADHWDVAGEARFVEVDGHQTIQLGGAPDQRPSGAQASLRGVTFTTGTIEYDVLAPGIYDFVGVAFRQQDGGNGELFYIRPHQNGNPDSTQYTPVVNGSLAWQIFTGDGFTSQHRFNYGHWMHVRADIYADSALFTVDGTPALVVPHLKSRSRSGEIGLTSVHGAAFANVSVTPIENYRDPNPAPPLPPLAAGMVPAWQVSPAMPEPDAMARAARSDWSGIRWQRIPVENHGIDNLSLAGADTDWRHTYIARFSLRSRAARTAAMEFGFSDKVHVYLNGQLLYAGHDEQGSRDYRFLGIVGFWDSLYLPLRAGANEVTFVVTDETNGGTAAAARFAPNPALTIE